MKEYFHMPARNIPNFVCTLNELHDKQKVSVKILNNLFGKEMVRIKFNDYLDEDIFVSERYMKDALDTFFVKFLCVNHLPINEYTADFFIRDFLSD